MRHETIEKNLGLMGVLILIVISMGPLVEITPQASCTAGSVPEYRYRYRPKCTTTWLLLQDWSESVAAWDTTGLAGGTYNIQVETRAPSGPAGNNWALRQACTRRQFRVGPRVGG